MPLILYYVHVVFPLDELVAKVLQVIENLMDVSQELLNTWSTPELVSAVHEASSLARFSASCMFELLLHCIL